MKQNKLIMKKTIIIALMVIISSLFSSTLLFAQQSKSFEVSVTGKGQPMLFIPGATSSGEVWKETIARYSKTNACHVFTLAGYAGLKAIDNQPYLEKYKEELINYIKSKKLKKVILVGHSIGGFLALNIAAEMKDHLEKVIIVDALPFYAGMMNPAAKSGFNKEQAEVLFNSYDKMDYQALKAGQLAVARTLCADSTKWETIAAWGAASDKKTMAYTMYEMLGNDIRASIAAIKVPVLVMAAFAPIPQYPQFTKEYVLTSYRQQYQACKTCEVRVTPSSKHFIMYDAPLWFYQEIDTFINAG
jgi:N-formylmaleamate deformylase